MDALDDAVTAIASKLPSAFTLTMTLSTSGDGHIGGIIGLNGTYGFVQHCVSGKWDLYNRSSNADSTMGGIIGLNETVEDLAYLFNFSNARRTAAQVSGGIVGRQENRSMSGWRIQFCGNYGAISANSGDRSAGVEIGRAHV